MKLETYFHFQIILAIYLSAEYVSGNLEPIELLTVRRKPPYAPDLSMCALFASKLYLIVQISL